MATRVVGERIGAPSRDRRDRTGRGRPDLVRTVLVAGGDRFRRELGVRVDCGRRAAGLGESGAGAGVGRSVQRGRLRRAEPGVPDRVLRARVLLHGRVLVRRRSGRRAFVGVAASWLHRRDLLAAIGVAVPAGIGSGEAVDGLLFLPTTSPVYWALSGTAALILLAGVCSPTAAGGRASSVRSPRHDRGGSAVSARDLPRVLSRAALDDGGRARSAGVTAGSRCGCRRCRRRTGSGGGAALRSRSADSGRRRRCRVRAGR